MPGASPGQGEGARDDQHHQDHREDQEDQGDGHKVQEGRKEGRKEGSKVQEDMGRPESQDDGHKDNERQEDTGRPISPLWSSVQGYYFMFKHVLAENFTSEQAHRVKRAGRRFKIGHRKNTLETMEYTRKRRVWEEKQARQNPAIYRPWEPPTPPPPPPTSVFEPMMWPQKIQFKPNLAEVEHKITRVQASRTASPVCNDVQEPIARRQSQVIYTPQAMPLDLSIIKTANSPRDRSIYPVANPEHRGSGWAANLEHGSSGWVYTVGRDQQDSRESSTGEKRISPQNCSQGLVWPHNPAPGGARQLPQEPTSPAAPQRQSCIIYKASPQPAESAMVVFHTGITQSTSSTTMASSNPKATTSSLPIPLVAMHFKRPGQEGFTRLLTTPDTGASCSVISAHTAKMLDVEVDTTRKASLKDAQNNQLEVTGVATLTGRLEMAQELWASFEVIVSPNLAAALLLSHGEQKFFGILHPQWPHICLHQPQSTPGHHMAHSDSRGSNKKNLFQAKKPSLQVEPTPGGAGQPADFPDNSSSHQPQSTPGHHMAHSDSRGSNKKDLFQAKEPSLQVESTPGEAGQPADSPDNSGSFETKWDPGMRGGGAPMKFIQKKNLAPHKMFKARILPSQLYGKAKAMHRGGQDKVESPPTPNPARKAKVDAAKVKPVGEAVWETFDPTKESVVVTNTCVSGLGFALLQVLPAAARSKRRPRKLICAGFRTLTPREARHSPLFTEAMAVSSALQRLEPFLKHSPNFSLLTNHTLLAKLFCSSAIRCPERLLAVLQSWQCFQNRDIRCISPKQNTPADILPRKYILQSCTVTPNSEFVFSLKRQAVLQSALFLDGSRVLAPIDQPGTPLKKSHQDLTGSNRAIQKTNQVCFWRTVPKDIESICGSCKACASPQEAPALPQPTQGTVPRASRGEVARDQSEVRGDCKDNY